MPQAAHPTRTKLLEAGLDLAEQTALSGLSVDDIVRGAGVAKGTFYVHFKDRDAYLVALHDQFHAQLRAAIATESQPVAAGAARVEAATTAYLDGCLAAHGVKAMLLQSRGIPAIAERVAASNERFATAARDDFAVIGFRYALESARLYVAMVAEAALIELEAGTAVPAVRMALSEFLSRS